MSNDIVINDSTVVAIQNVAVSNEAPTDGYVLTYVDGYSEWQPKPLPDALPPTGVAGGDLGGTYPNPNVININGASVPAAGALTPGNVLQVFGASALDYAPINLAGGSDYVSGVLPSANQAAQSMGGDVSGTTASATVAKLQGTSVANAAPTDGYVLTYVGSNSDWEPKPLPASGITGLRKDYFTSSGTWTCPAGVTNVLIVAAGGGGGGGGGGSSQGLTPHAYGAGGGGGAIQQVSNMAVTPGNTYDITIGSGGSGSGGATGATGPAGSSGGNTQFKLSGTLLFSAKGGGGGGGGGRFDSSGGIGGYNFPRVVGQSSTSTISNGANGGSGGTGVSSNGNSGEVNYINEYNGGSGGGGSSGGGFAGSGGGGGGAGPQGDGGNGGGGGTSGNGGSGSSPSANTGAGGGGGGGSGGGSGGNGAGGGSGYLYIIY